MKFSRLTIVAPRAPSSRATYAPAKPPPTTSTPPRACLVSVMSPSIAEMAVQVAVVWSGVEHEARAEAVGRLLAESGATVVTGGLGEVMAAAARGAKSAGGT